MIKVFHGSNEIISAIKDDSTDMFGGLFFASSECDAHGPIVHSVELDEDEICTSYDLVYGDCDYDKIKAAILSNVTEQYFEEYDDLHDLICGDKDFIDSEIDSCRLQDILGCNECYEAWALQRIRGQVAKALGYKAIEMSDEHGTSYLVLPGTTLKKI